jgi:AbrB family looped-hinge helix DNA binding protein
MHMYHSHIDKAGRVIIPSAARKALGLQVGDAIVLHVDTSGIRLSSAGQTLASLQQLMQSKNPVRTNMVDELIAERRSEALREHDPA